jgi:hypothetical protein
MKMLKHVIQAFDILSDAKVTGEDVAKAVKEMGLNTMEVKTVEEIVPTQFIKALIPGTDGKAKGGQAPTLGVIGGAGGIGARPRFLGLVSDADGAVAAVSVLFGLISMQNSGDFLKGDVIVTTHICPNAPTIPHDPVPFMGNPTKKALTKTKNFVDPNMDAIVHAETSRGNRVINFRGFAITPTIKECYVLKVSNDVMDIMQNVTGRSPRVVPITTQDVTPIDNGVYHMNGLAQETVLSDAPIVGVALTSAVPVAGCAPGASQITDIEMASRFIMEVAKAYTAGECKFYDEEEFEKILGLYGSMKHLRKL